jgi:hypothetical protein
MVKGVFQEVNPRRLKAPPATHEERGDQEDAYTLRATDMTSGYDMRTE